MPCGIPSRERVFCVLNWCDVEATTQSRPHFLYGWLQQNFLCGVDAIAKNCTVARPNHAGRGIEVKDSEFVISQEGKTPSRPFRFLAGEGEFRIPLLSPA